MNRIILFSIIFIIIIIIFILILWFTKSQDILTFINNLSRKDTFINTTTSNKYQTGGSLGSATNTDPAPIFPWPMPDSVYNYYGDWNDYLMDRVSKGYKIPYYRSLAPYCDEPHRNRNFLVNPQLTQKHIFIKPNINAFTDKGWYADSLVPGSVPGPDFGNSAWDIRIGATQELMVPQINSWYNNFTDVVNKMKNPEFKKLYLDSVTQRCGLKNSLPTCNWCGSMAPKNTLTNPY